MNTNDNPFASPQTTEPYSPGQTWVVNRSAGLVRTSHGLNLVYYGIVLVLVSVITGALAGISPMLAVIPIFGFGIGYLMLLIGPIFCLAVPAETGAKGMIILSVLLQLASLASTIVVPALGDRVPPTVVSAGGYCALGGSFFFVLFMRKLATYIGRTDLRSRATSILVLGTIALAILIAGMLGSTWLDQRLYYVAAAALLLFLVVFVMYANLINSLRTAINPPQPIDAALHD